jgi:hypothetical protein
MTVAVEDIEQRLSDLVTESVSARSLGDGDGRIGCVTPLQYPDGDNVIVWVRPRIDGEFEVTDYGDALAESVAGKTKERSNLEEFATSVAAAQGVRFVRGRLFAEAKWDRLPEYIWAVATVASQLAQAAATHRPRQQREPEPESEFVSVVAQDLGARGALVEREHRLSGKSGHRHHATLYLPQTETVIEPVGGHWNQVTSVFARLADLRGTNGYRLLSLLDDRETKPEDDVSGLLVQVSNVVEWSRRDEWMRSVIAGAAGSDALS